MSVENFEGEGFGDQPSIIYMFEKDKDGGAEVRELSRSGYGSPGASPGEVIEREATKSSPETRLPELDLPGWRGLHREDCGEDRPTFGCASEEGCGNPVYVGRTCASPVCERCWPAAVKEKVVRTAGKLEGLRRALYARHDGRRDIDFQHVVASLPSVKVDAEDALERILLVLKTLLEEQWDIDGFVAIFHPYRIKKEFRKDQYDHGGEPGEGEMTWGDVLSSEEPEKYLTFEPHFHTFFPALRGSFDYLTAEAVEEQSGWLFHRITKGKESNVSVSDLDDLVNQLTYCFSHAGIREVGPRFELASRMKGDLHECYIPDGVADEVLAMFCDAAPKLLGTRFTNVAEATCEAVVSGETGSSGRGSDRDECSEESSESERRHPLADVWDVGDGMSSPSREADPWPDGTLDAGTGSEVAEGASASSSKIERAASEEEVSDTSGPGGGDDREVCGGSLKPISEAAKRLEDEAWCEQAEHVEGLRTAVAEWSRLTDGDEEVPWLEDGEDEEYSEVVQGD